MGISIVFFTLLCCALPISAVRISPTVRNMEAAADHKLLDINNVNISSIEEQHRSVQRHAVKSIRSPDGDTIDCIPPSKQLAFHHPSLKNHKLQEAPTNVSPHRRAYSHDHNNGGQGYNLLQLWHQNGRCPNGTIPVRRITAHEMSRTSSSLPQYASKYYYGDPQVIGGVDHQHSYGSESNESPYYGTQATFSLWDPSVELESEFSLAQLWVLATAPPLNSLEAGWQVYPGKYGDNSSRLFVFWTRDDYSGSGCYNLDCPGFVQTSSNVLVGGALSSVSTIDGPQQEAKFSVFKDPETGNWWLEFNEEFVGYWPQNLSYLTSSYANLLEWGGEIIDTEQNGQHTKTQMGSGNFAQDGYGKAAYIRNLQWFDVNQSLHIVSNLQVQAEKPTCYNITTLGGYNSWGTYFFFGGPGQNPDCP